MSIEKKSLISTLKTTKKANAATSAPEASTIVSKKQVLHKRASKRASMRQSLRRA
jgi:hypothetical protein